MNAPAHPTNAHPPRAPFAQVLYEDPDTIRMQESLDLFDKWANHPDFATKPVVVAFTKKDIYHKNFNLEKFKVRPLLQFCGCARICGC